MSTKSKLMKRFLGIPKDFTYDETKKLLTNLGYIEHNKGKTSGSRVMFFHPDTKAAYYLHRPHPDNIIHPCYLKQLIIFLKEHGDISE